MQQILNKPTLSPVALSGSYNDLANQPTIPSIVDASTSQKGVVKLAGDLSGTADVPTVADGAISTSKLADDSVTPAKLNATGASSGQLLSFDGSNVAWTNPPAQSSAGGIITWEPNTSYSVGQSVIAPTGDVVTPIADFTSGSSYNSLQWNIQIPVSNYSMDKLWRPSNVLAVPSILQASTGTITPASGTAYVIGGPGCVIPKGRTANQITFLNNAASAGMTHTWFFLAVPSGSTNSASVVAITKDNGTATWPTNTYLTLSLKTVDGGTGGFTPTTDTPVYIGIVQTGTTPATLRGISGNGFVGGLISARPWWGAAGNGLTTPATLSGVVTINNTNFMASACYVSE